MQNTDEVFLRTVQKTSDNIINFINTLEFVMAFFINRQNQF